MRHLRYLDSHSGSPGRVSEVASCTEVHLALGKSNSHATTVATNRRKQGRKGDDVIVGIFCQNTVQGGAALRDIA